MQNTVKYYAPASMGNVNVGFDTLGLAYERTDGQLFGDVVHITGSDDNIQLITEGKYASKLPTDIKQNGLYMGWLAFKQFLQEKKGRNLEQQPHFLLEKNLPVGSGLGSSASSAVATILALNAYYQAHLSQKELLELMAQAEKFMAGGFHLDNILPSYLGGIQLILEDSSPENASFPYQFYNLPIFQQWYWVVAYPGFALETQKARTAMPQHYDMQTVIKSQRYLAGFLHGSHTQNSHLAQKSLCDVLAAPYRGKLIKGYEKLIQVGQENDWTVGISGSGPSLFVLRNNYEEALQVQDWCNENFIEENGFVHICKIAKSGAYQLKN